VNTAPITATWSRIVAAKETPVAVATLNVGELPAPAAPPAPAPAPEPAPAPSPALAAAGAEESAKIADAKENTVASTTPSTDAADVSTKPVAAREARKDDAKKPERSDAHVASAKKPNPLLVKASARSGEIADEKTKLSDARAAAHERASDPKALKAWATAALHAGEMREARRAAEAWAVHDNSAEPRMFLAATLEAAGRKREARAVLEEWLANHPDSSDAKRMLNRLGGTPEPAIKRGGRSRAGRVQLHPPDPVATEE
jgi:hypothetical protein